MHKHHENRVTVSGGVVERLIECEQELVDIVLGDIVGLSLVSGEDPDKRYTMDEMIAETFKNVTNTAEIPADKLVAQLPLE